MTNEKEANLQLDIINAFGADLNPELRDNIDFISDKNCIIYPVGYNLIIRSIELPDKAKDNNNNLSFIYLDSDLIKITSMKTSEDKSMLILCEEKKNHCSVSLYYLSKIHFDFFSLYKPKRKIMLNSYSSIINANYCSEGNIISVLAKEKKTNQIKGLIFDVTSHTPFQINKSSPIITFSLTNNANKISFENKLICVTGKFHLSFWFLYKTQIKEFKTANNISQVKDYIDHSWLIEKRPPTCIVLSSENEIFVIEGIIDKNREYYSKGLTDDYLLDKIDQFAIKQHIQNIFTSFDTLGTVLKSFSQGIVIGNTKGDLLFIEKKQELGSIKYEPVKVIERKKQSAITGIALNKKGDYIVIAYASSEIAYLKINSIFEAFRTKENDLPFNIICEGFHSGNISAIDICLQRPIIITASNVDKTIRVWNYISGHCEYCKIVLMEHEHNLMREMNISSIALHPNGYYVALANEGTIWFFHLCYKELRFYGINRKLGENSKGKCSLLKFSNGGHLLAAVIDKQIYLLQSYSREVCKVISTNHIGTLMSILFSSEDEYIYSFGTDGFIYQFNLFTLQRERLVSKYIHYIDASFLSLNNSMYSIIACGLDDKNYSITELNIHPAATEEDQLTDSKITIINERVSAILLIKSKKFDISGVVIGTEEGKVGILKQPYHECKIEWDRVKAHKGRVNKLVFNRDTNLLFSIGSDGNIFVYCIYEYINEEISLEDTKNDKVKALNAILDEGLGDNALFPINKLKRYEEELSTNIDIKAKFENLELINKIDKEDSLKQLESECAKKREIEVKHLNDRIIEAEEKNKETIKQYERKMEEAIEENRIKYNELNKLGHAKIEMLEDHILAMTSEITQMKNQYEKGSDMNSSDVYSKYKVLEKEVRGQIIKYKKEKEEIEMKLKWKEEEEVFKLSHMDKEHELEKKLMKEKYEKTIGELKEQIENQRYEIVLLKDSKIKIQEDLIEKGREANTLLEKIESYSELVKTLKQALNSNEINKERLASNLSLIEKKLQEKEQSEFISNKIKTFLYKKNVEIASSYSIHEQKAQEIKKENMKLEKSINKASLILEDKEIQSTQMKLRSKIEKQNCEEMRKKAIMIQETLDNILYKLYDSYQTHSRNDIIKAVDEIYKKYLCDDEIIRRLNARKLNGDIRQELENQLSCYLSGYRYLERDKRNAESHQTIHLNKKMDQNSNLLESCSDLKRNNLILNKEVQNLNSIKQSLESKIKQIKKKKEEVSRNVPVLPKNRSMPDIFEKQYKTIAIQKIRSNYITRGSSNNNSIDSRTKIKSQNKQSSQCISIKHLKNENDNVL